MVPGTELDAVPCTVFGDLAAPLVGELLAALREGLASSPPGSPPAPMPLSLNKVSHVSRFVNAFVIMPAICSFVLTYLMDMHGCCMTSNVQSKFTRCVRETCLKAILRCLVTILMTASLSSQTMRLIPVPEDFEAIRVVESSPDG